MTEEVSSELNFSCLLLGRLVMAQAMFRLRSLPMAGLLVQASLCAN